MWKGLFPFKNVKKYDWPVQTKNQKRLNETTIVDNLSRRLTMEELKCENSPSR